MNRREILKYTSLTFGVVASGGLASTLLSGCKVEPKIDYTPSFVSMDEFKTLRSVVDIIFPKTETPGAAEVGVAEFIDETLVDVADAEAKESFKTGMLKLNEATQKQYGKAYNNLGDAEKTDFLTKVDAAAFAGDESNQDAALSEFWRGIKGSTYFGYFSSEAIGKNVLAYPIQGRFEGCVDLEEVSGGKIWAF